MKKERKYYLVAVWHPHRGSTKENPAYALCTINRYPVFPLKDIDLDVCYTSDKRAQRVADKHNGSGWPWAHHAVIEVSKEFTVNEEGEKCYGWKYVSA